MEPRGAIYLVNRAPIDITYSHSIDFTSPEEQLSYWGSKVKYRLQNYSYIRRERRYINIEKTYEELDGINYLYYQARENSKYYFCFVTEREYINEKATRIYFEVDVLQSFMFDYSWKPSYIAQAHVDRWDANQKPKYSYTDEGLDYGSEYMLESAYKVEPVAEPNNAHGFYLVYCVQHKDYVGSGDASECTLVEDTPVPYDIYLVPEIRGMSDVELCYFDNGEANAHVCTTIAGFLKFMSRSGFGNYVKQIAYVPYCPFTYKLIDMSGIPCFAFTNMDTEANLVYTTLGDPNYKGTEDQAVYMIKIDRVYKGVFSRVLAEMDVFSGLEGVMPTADMWSAIKAKPYKTERDRRYESKLLTFPYRYNLLTDWANAPCVIKNEYICGEKITVKESFGVGFNTPRRYYLKNYRKDIEGREASLMQALPLEAPILTDQYYTYMLENKNQIEANITNAKINATYGAISSGVSGAMGGLAMGGPVGALMGGLMGAGKSAIESQISISNMLRSENAKQADIKALPDSLITSNDSCYAISDNKTYLTFYRKAIACDYAERLAQYWHMFGYIVKSLAVPNTRSRLRYNYIRTVGANIEGNIESSYLAQIKAIYDNGVTLWHYHATDFYPLDYTYENIERSML